ncbi:molybdopterin-guanine dinucleotide biosynthesis protein B [Archangium lansingense]|uniref:molybdopterin-guanine dinucleotide biosynthesis protein B n=1 Tax=Archangium lansingense TaxID=2995310 RepID=UPI003B7F04AA
MRPASPGAGVKELVATPRALRVVPTSRRHPSRVPTSRLTPFSLSFPEPPSQLERFADTVDLVLVEGWKQGPLPKLEVWREELGPLLARTRQDVLCPGECEGSHPTTCKGLPPSSSSASTRGEARTHTSGPA